MSMFRYLLGNKRNEKHTIIEMLKDIDLLEYQKTYIINRYIDILYDDFDVIAIKNKVAFQSLRFITLFTGVLIPIIANLKDPLTVLNLDRTNLITILGIFSSLSFGFLQIYRNERVWLHHREMFERLRTEGYKFLSLSGKYKSKTHKEAFPMFSASIEELIKNDITSYTSIMAKGERNEGSAD